MRGTSKNSNCKEMRGTEGVVFIYYKTKLYHALTVVGLEFYKKKDIINIIKKCIERREKALDLFLKRF